MMRSADFVDLVIERVPEAEPKVRENFADNDGELLLHLLMSDLLRLAVSWFDQGMVDPLERLLAAVDGGLAEGDDYVKGAVAVSFVDDTGWWESSTQPFIEAWPAGLQAEVDRQRSHRT
ncbi:DUF7674 family protein [Nocardioides lijunqiniae]|uniref:DUF7674 family protein n=1 Tax=Nocardioides lijunqiniae TaxID=2760832 RepID=UPI001878F417|nr:hypothetical protein [Nocardioides lijunqiniae]